jgi:hypothetical protein
MGALTTKTRWRNPHHKKPASASNTTATVTPIAILDGPGRPSAELFPPVLICTLTLLPFPSPSPFPFPLPLLLVAVLEGDGIELEVEVTEAVASL